MVRVVLALIVMCLAACGGNPAAPAGVISTNTATIVAIRIVPDVTTLKVGATQQFSVTETMGPGVPPTGPAPRWSIGDSSIALVNGSGQVTAISPGRTTVTVTFFGETDLRMLDVVP
jgi:uncharacterized protein YjdB